MEILELKAMRGPNYWSISRSNLIVMELDLKDLEELPTDKIIGFSERIQKLIPSLFEHRCSEGKAGGFFSRVNEGTWMGHVVEHIALEIQTLAGMFCGFGRTRSTKKKGVYTVVFSYCEEPVGLYAATAAVKIAQALVNGEAYDLENDLQTMRSLKERSKFGPSTASIINEAITRNIPYMRVNDESLIQLGYGKNQVRFRATMTNKTSSIAVDIASNKDETKRLLREAGMRVAESVMISSPDELKEAVETVGFPLVFKPLDGNHGRGVSINIQTMDECMPAFEHAKTVSRKIIVEKFISGNDFRVLVINNRFTAAALREPAKVTGDGVSTIQQLIDAENKDPRRGEGHENVLTKISIDKDSRDQLGKKNYTLETVLANGEAFYLKGTANISTGGTSTDVTDSVHPDIVSNCERISRIIGLDICGIDIIASDLTESLENSGGVILEVNAAPGFRMHLAPSSGISRNVAATVLDMLYPERAETRIPIIAITGTNGKTTTTRLIAHIVKDQGYKVGYSTTDGIYIDNAKLSQGDSSGPSSAHFIFKDPTVEFAVLETARGGILRSGLAFEFCDIGVVTNVQEDHLGLLGIDTIDEMAKVKGVVAESVKRSGYAILNADNSYCVDMARNTSCKVAFFSMNENNPVITEHCAQGGLAAIVENGYITIKKGEWKNRIEKVNSIPLTFSGTLHFMTENVLAATLAAYTYGFKAQNIAASLATFIPSPVQTPGRMNIFDFKNFRVMIDFAHNPASYRGVQEFLATIDSPQKIGIITGTGDRRDSDVKQLGRLAGQMFDHIIIKQEKYLRGRPANEIVNLLEEGIRETDPTHSYEFLPDGTDALKHAFKIAKNGAFITALSAVIDNWLELLHFYQNQERDGKILSEIV